MTQHAHSQFVEGCYRCDLSNDEVSGTVAGLDLERLEELAEKATPGPWRLDSHAHPLGGCRCMSCYQSSTVWQAGGMFCDDVPQREADAEDQGERCDQFGYTYDDAAFIAALRNAVPSLLAAARAVERVRALHHPVDWKNAPDDYGTYCPSCGEDWPCPTRAALGTEQEGLR